MRKSALLFSCLLVSFNVFALSSGSTSLNSKILSAVQNSAKSSINPAIVYGGQDISRSVIATADESIWSGAPRLIV